MKPTWEKLSIAVNAFRHSKLEHINNFFLASAARKLGSDGIGEDESNSYIWLPPIKHPFIANSIKAVVNEHQDDKCRMHLRKE